LDCGVEPFFLYEQYRMVANIRKFPSLHFYGDRLTDSKSVQERKFPPYLSKLQERNLLFIDLKFSKETMEEYSFYNKSEIEYYDFPLINF
jgi:Superfamily I DNA and RNA helicases and helicase subunits